RLSYLTGRSLGRNSGRLAISLWRCGHSISFPPKAQRCPRSFRSKLRNQAVRGSWLLPRLFWGNHVKTTFISAAAILAFAATAAHADELTDIQAQAKQLREQNAAMTKRLAEIEKRQKALESQKPAINPVDAMAADLPYKAAV